MDDSGIRAIAGGGRPITYGRQLGRLDVNGFALIEALYSPGFSIPLHAHDNTVWVYVVEGCVAADSGGRRCEVSAGGLRWVPAGIYHRNTYGTAACRCLLIEFGPNQAQHLGACSDVLRRDAAYRPGDAPARVARQVYAEFSNRDPLAPLAIEGLLLGAVVGTARAQRGRGGPPAWLERIRDALDSGYRRGVSIAELSSAEGIHPVHAAREFRRHFGCSPSEFARARRVQLAADALRTTGDPISQIAWRSGFADQSHLAREFRKTFGTTPAAFRRAARARVSIAPR